MRSTRWEGTVKPMPKIWACGRFLLWFLWPLGAVVLLFAAGQTIENLVGKDTHELWVYPIYLLILTAIAVFAVWMVVHVVRALGMLRRRAGWFTAAERAQMSRVAAYQTGFARAADLKSFLIAGGDPLRLQVWDVMLEQDETVLMDVPLSYARWYGTDGSYAHSTVTAAGRPSFVAGALIGNAIGNAVRRSNAAAAARTMWREHETVRALVTDRRILCRTGHGWLSFWYGGVSASYPDPLGATLILEFHDAAPLRLHGYDGAALCVFAAASLQGRNTLRSHPALAVLTQPQA